jgi:hypothetical protein
VGEEPQPPPLGEAQPHPLDGGWGGVGGLPGTHTSHGGQSRQRRLDIREQRTVAGATNQDPK